MLALAALAMSAALSACGSDSDPSRPQTVGFEFTFAEDDEGWAPGFADLPVDTDPDAWKLDASHRPLPAGLTGGGLYIQGNNHSDDLFMYWTRAVGGLSPSTTYRASATIDLATNIGVGTAGIGGSPGESVFVKAGASTTEPTTVADDTGHARLSLDKGNQSTGGREMIVIGDVAHPDVTGDEFRIKTFDDAGLSVEVTTDAQGTVWLIVGTDSGFEGLSRLYWSRIVYSLTPAE